MLISPQGLFAGTVGVRRLLKLFEKYDMKTTWFIPGHSLETVGSMRDSNFIHVAYRIVEKSRLTLYLLQFPEECAMIRDAGHEMYGLNRVVRPEYD